MGNIQSLLHNDPLFVFALEEEASDKFTEYNPVFIGVGKINATYHLTRAILQRKPGIIINLGSAGSNLHPRGAIVCCTRFVQRDMDVTALGFEIYQTPFSKEPKILEYGLKPTALLEGICGSGDCFITDHLSTDYDVIDMEAYPIAWVAKKENIPFLCLKYITDGADGSAALEWTTAVKQAAAALKTAIVDLDIPVTE
jgi:adenosylhomocysteine nucleosidase